jgi:hypothetical protein
LSTKDDLIRLINALKRKVEALDPPATAIPLQELSEPEPPRKPTAKPGSAEWYLQHTPPKHEGVVEMNALARGIPRPRPPRAPGKQSRRFNGLWYY